MQSEHQLTYYNSGIGTYAKPSWRSWSYAKQVLDHKIDLAIAWWAYAYAFFVFEGVRILRSSRNLEKIVMAAYRWLSENYQENDRIFLFGVYLFPIHNTESGSMSSNLTSGFSRGAYQVRALAGMIEKVGRSFLIRVSLFHWRSERWV